jgi:hypothetical protein
MLDISPFSLSECLKAIPPNVLLIFRSLVSMVMSPGFSRDFFNGLRENLDYRISSVPNPEAVQEKLNGLVKESVVFAADLPETMNSQPVIEKPDFAAINRQDPFEGISPIERRVIKYYLDEFVPDELRQYMLPNERPSCLLVRIGYPSPNEKHAPVKLLFNAEGENLFGYTSAELQYFVGVRDLQNLWVFKRTGRFPPPGTFQ